ncbi:hypothetical protein IX306_001704 [Porphyromonas levii]|nr:hypothetical protein [Porphyromonas levii]MBR8766493.1 hypothetical protein [Porphyromonas levii]MBR8774572.1 hypothetical protein [Porphyromonas levii]MBR8801715.1 hypothetical protein [Porphyromonas levii]
MERSNWRDDQKHGLYERWYDNGQLCSRENYKEGKKEGLCEILRLDMKVDSVICDMGKEVSRQVLNDFTPIKGGLQNEKKTGKHLNIPSLKRKRGRGL